MKDIYDFIKSFDLHTIIVVGIAFYFLNGNITTVKEDLSQFKTEMKGQFARVDLEFAKIEKEMAIIKTVLIMKDIMPTELAYADKIDES